MEKSKRSRRSSRKKSVAAAAPVRDIMDIKALANYLGMGKSKIYALIRHKKIPASRIGRQYRFSKEIVDQWLKEKLITQKDDSHMSFFQNKPEPSNRNPLTGEANG